MTRHFTREALTRLLSGPVNEAETARAIQHVVSCRRCLASAEGCFAHERIRESPGSRALEARNALRTVIKAKASCAIATLKAESWWADLMELSPAEQIKKIHSTAALQSLPVFETILAAAKAVGLSDPYLGEVMIRAALTVAECLPEPRFSRALKNDLLGEGMTAVVNFRRIAADWPGSAEAITEARRYLAHGTRDPGLEAGLLSIHCSLCTDTGDLEKALTFVRRAVEIFRELEDWHGVAHNSVAEANCLLVASRPAEAIDRANFALERMPAHDLRLQALARFILVESLVLLERPLEALRYFMEAKPLCEQGDLGTRLRAAHCKARLLDSLGCARESEKLFRSAVKSCFDHELYKESFMTLLSLFECFCRRGALGKAAALCEDAIEATSEVGAACNDQIRRAWEELLAAVRVRQLSEAELVAARQYLVRNWSVPRGGALALQRLAVAPARETAAPEPPPPPPIPTPEAGPSRFQAAREEYDRRLIVAALEQTGGNISEAGRLLDVSRNTLKVRMRLYGLHRAGDLQ
jgi:tetratricopeptide (TPR) repeat protein